MSEAVAGLEASNNCNNLIGVVKWFNNKSGYGFVTCMTGSMFKGKDIFVHHSSIKSKEDLYKYLVQGEYIRFDIQEMKSESHEHQACNIRGICDGPLMCETRYKNKDSTRSRDGFTHIKKGSRRTTD
tara:strand:- start:115 stop:495 length:381 start_codon:yes stop_codon:yes gene_type:complete